MRSLAILLMNKLKFWLKMLTNKINTVVIYEALCFDLAQGQMKNKHCNTPPSQQAFIKLFFFLPQPNAVQL